MILEGIFHKADSNYCFAISNNEVSLRLQMSNQDNATVKVIYGGKYDFATIQQSVTMTKSYTDDLYSYYCTNIVLSDLRLVYIFEITCDGNTYYYTEDGITSSYDYEYNYYNAFQLAYINEIDVHREVEFMNNACFYMIFVDRFASGDKDKDRSYIDMPWGGKPTPSNFAGGDLKGITSKLDYLADMGINALYLTSIFSSPTNHKYDIRDYYSIDTMFGNKQHLQEMVAKAHDKGIRVVLDAVFNHVSSSHSYFVDVLEHGKQSPYYNYFVIDGDEIDTENVNYQCFAACDYMPKWNTNNPEVQQYLIDIALYYIRECDIDGWRLDVSDEISHDFWRKFRLAVKAEKSQFVIIGENWHNANSYLLGDQYDGIMNYAFTKACLDYFAFGQFSTTQLANKLNRILMLNNDTVNKMMLNMLDSHDTHRFLTRVEGDMTKLGSALALTMMYVGCPSIYYGTEIGMEGGYDPDCRRTMDWELASKGSDIQQLTKSLIQIRTKLKALHNSNIKIYSQDDVLYVDRWNQSTMIRLTLNGGQSMPLQHNICTNAQDQLDNGQFMIQLIQL